MTVVTFVLLLPTLFSYFLFFFNLLLFLLLSFSFFFCCVVGVLLAAGADVNACAFHELPPLHLAITNSQVAIIRQLLAAGADTTLRCQRYQRTALCYAVLFGTPECFQLVLDHTPNHVLE